MRIRYTYQGNESIFETALTTVVVGRPKPGVKIDLDLTPDHSVSRPHAQILHKDDQWWLEDLDSGWGTKLEGQETKGRGPVALAAGNSFRVGDTTLCMEELPLDNATKPATVDGAQAKVDKAQALEYTIAYPAPDLSVSLSPLLPAGDPLVMVTAPVPSSTAIRHQRLLYSLLLQFGTEAPLDELLQFAMERIIAAIPGAERGALLIKELNTGQLLLKAHLPHGQPAVSSTLAEHALNCRGGFIWQKDQDLSVSQIEHRMASGMYAPLLWKGKAFGVFCVDNCNGSRAFHNDDLELLVAAAQHTALALANHELHDNLRRNAELVDRLLTNFSPAIRRRLMDRARQGRLRLGGENSEVTIVTSDIRGFSRTTANMEAEDIVDMLNTYFSALVEVIFQHDGTVDKFVGDGILAVFGSPEHDDEQHAKAVRAAIAMQSALKHVNSARRAHGQVVCEIGIGVHCGEVLHGFIGSDACMEFTVIGDAVNRTSRFCDGAGAGEVLISPELHQRVWKIVQAVPTTIKTKHEGDWSAFRVISIKDKTVSKM
ncbi:MAG TPA: adenylate/guanylate cyclase domain-containing protein [Pirellulales bacterium]